MRSTHPKPDRSNYKPNARKTADNPQLDIGWNEGWLSDGRPYRAEAWAEEAITSLTFFFSTSGIENLTNKDFADLLEREKLLAYVNPKRRSAYAAPLKDASGNPMWSVNVVIGDEEQMFARDTVVLLPYGDRPGASPSAEAAR